MCICAHVRSKSPRAPKCYLSNHPATPNPKCVRETTIPVTNFPERDCEKRQGLNFRDLKQMLPPPVICTSASNYSNDITTAEFNKDL